MRGARCVGPRGLDAGQAAAEAEFGEGPYPVLERAVCATGRGSRVYRGARPVVEQPMCATDESSVRKPRVGGCWCPFAPLWGPIGALCVIHTEGEMAQRDEPPYDGCMGIPGNGRSCPHKATGANKNWCAAGGNGAGPAVHTFGAAAGCSSRDWTRTTCPPARVSQTPSRFAVVGPVHRPRHYGAHHVQGTCSREGHACNCTCSTKDP